MRAGTDREQDKRFKVVKRFLKQTSQINSNIDGGLNETGEEYMKYKISDLCVGGS